MKNLTKILMIAVIAIMASCSKEGPQGPAGTNGTNGTDGNANVTVFTFGSQTTTSGSLSYVLPIEKSKVDSSVIVVYYNHSLEGDNYWYTVPGIGSAESFETRYYFYRSGVSPSKYTLQVNLYNVGTTTFHTTSRTFSRLRVFVISANNFINGRTRDPRSMTYEEVCAAYNIKP